MRYKANSRSLPGNMEIRRMEDIIKNISHMVLIADNETKIVWANQALEDFAGFGLTEMADKPVAYFLDRIQVGHELAEQVNDRLEKVEVFSLDLSVFTDKDSPCWVHGDFTPVFDDLGQYNGYILFFTDISGIKKKEEFLLRQNEVLREIAWIESHEVRRPLASILGLIELLKSCTSDDEKQEVFEMILVSGGKLDVMIRKINERIIEVMV
jgi:PAS domain S-box-containing protein